MQILSDSQLPVAKFRDEGGGGHKPTCAPPPHFENAGTCVPAAPFSYAHGSKYTSYQNLFHTCIATCVDC